VHSGKGEDNPEPVSRLNDQDLARQAGLGDRFAFAEIFHRHAAAMFRYAVHMLDGDIDQAEDAVQEALTQAWVHLPRFRGDSALRTWLFRITANCVLSARRRRRPIAGEDWVLTLPAGPDSDPVAHAQHEELWAALEAALGELPWRQRASWLLRELEGLSYEEIADILDTSPTVIRGQLHRARGTLAVRMAQWR
jgi:RNA polymerase sigma-70 factor, ECF subfamily